jgi:GGDEF domain-containing protein
MEPFRRLQRELAWISLAAAIVSIVASIVIARGIAQPVRSLAGFARRVATGEFATVPATSRKDEIGDLATAFRMMLEGMASREERITNLAYRDTLTGLPNRTLFADRADHALAVAARERSTVAVLLMDIDHFKYVNDTLGHAIGDLLLLEVAARIQRRRIRAAAIRQ